jgi:hypothetical protein
MKAKQAWAKREPWGVDIYLTVECECGHVQGDASYSAPHGESKAVIGVLCHGCAVRSSVAVDVGEALRAGD